MVAALFSLDHLLSALDPAQEQQQPTLILTPNSRLRNKIQQAYSQHCHSRGSQVGYSPRVFSLAEWADELWQQLLDEAYPRCTRAIANQHQRTYLWQQLIKRSELGAELLRAEQLAVSADAAYRNLELWQLDLTDVEPTDDLDAEVFVNWCRQFRQLLQEHNLITLENAYQVLIDAIKQGHAVRESRIILQSFDDIPPLHRALLETAALQLVEAATPKKANSRVKRVEAADFESEIRWAALWSRDCLQLNPDAVIGIIVPNLGQCRDQVERCFTEIFEPRALLPETSRYTLPFNFSAGIPLGSTPLIYDTLQLLRLNSPRWEVEPLCDLLHSPFWGDSEAQLPLRTLLSQHLRNLGKLQLSTTDLRYFAEQLAEKLGEESTPTSHYNLAACLQQVETLRRQALRQNSARGWAELFQQQLAALQWPGKRRLDSNEYQQVNQWYQLLARFSELDATGCRLPLHEALKELQNLATSTHFQAQTPDSPIQILGSLEGAGLTFTHCWVMGLHRRDWPPIPTPNPLLPLDLQRQHNMPHASVERELEFAEALTSGYRGCAEEVIFSSPAFDGETPLYPSTLIADLTLAATAYQPSVSASALQAGVPANAGTGDTLTDYYRQLVAKAPPLTLVDCHEGPALLTATAEDTTPTAGGSAILQMQAACPFNAFAAFRLGAREDREASFGLSAIERGVILHDSLANIWNSLKDSQTLQQTAPEALAQLIEGAVSAALAPWQQRRASEITPFYCQLEQQRLQLLISRWLELEQQRPAFSVVCVEKSMLVDFYGLQLNLRVDRIDQLEDGQLLLIDYKTGSPKVNRWQGERPDEPQLPLYALCLSESREVAAVSFAQVNIKDVKFAGLGELPADTAIEGIQPVNQVRGLQLPPEWNAVKEYWGHALQNLTREFCEGYAAVDYKDVNARRYSEAYTPLNRHLEQLAVAEFIRQRQPSQTSTAAPHTRSLERD